MADNFGNGVSRTLTPKQTQFLQTVFQEGKPPLDAEFNLIQQLENDWRQQLVLRGTPSGFLGNETNATEDFVTNPNWSNFFRFGRQRSGESKAIPWAVVNGWLIPVTGTLTGTPPGSPNNADTWNKVTLDPPPSNSGDFRIDFVFLEVWQAKIAPGPSSVNKPSASAIYRYGNVEGGAAFLPDDLQDPAIGFETTQRVQLQYRLRVVKGLIGLSTYPDGFDPTAVKAQGAASTVTSFPFANMRQELGDPGLWRAGDGSTNALGTVDGYTYAIPLGAVFRRNGVVWTGDPSPNLNGGFNRNPTAVDRTGTRVFGATPTLGALLSSSATTLTLTSATGLPLPTAPASEVLIQIGDELITYTSISGTTMSGLTRGKQGTVAEAHAQGAEVIVLSGRPDGLFSDQIATTDILDLRHFVNPNGFDYETLLKSNLDKLLRGQLHSNWKRSGGGPQGTFVSYQDKISASPAAVSSAVTKVDSPDGIRLAFSDAAMTQKVEVIVKPRPNTVTSPTQEPVGSTWSLAINAVTNSQKAANQFSAETAPADGTGDTIIVSIAQFKTSLPGSDGDQVRFLNDSISGAVTIYLDGRATPINPSEYTVTPTNPGPNDDLQIKFKGTAGSFPTPNQLRVTLHVLYGAGRGLARRPDSIHSISLFNPSADLLVQPTYNPSNNFPLRASWAPLWSKYRSTVYKNLLPVTAEAYADLGSKTVILTPFRRIEFPVTRTMDGTGLNGGSQGLMPSNDETNAAKWGQTDPLNLFSGHTVADDALKDIYIEIPRHLVPGWGAIHAPILPLPSQSGVFHNGINFTLMAKKGINTNLTDVDHNRNYISYTGTAPLSYASFSTGNFSGGSTVPAIYNQTFSFSGVTHAGSRFFTDSRGLGRQGIELPPFYGVARLFAVYESADYKANGSAYNASTREPTGSGAKNLLKQNFDGPTIFVEIDADGDSTFILNADALDLSKSPTPINSFTSKHYVIEASIFGFDRGSYDLTKPFRLLLSRTRPSGVATTTGGIGNRSSNINVEIAGPVGILPGPMTASDTALVSYSRTPYQGDAWGSQSNYLDIGFTPGPLQSLTAYQLVSSVLDESSLTRPNQKALEVLSSVGFVTTLGTGRLSGDLSSDPLDFRNVGFEDPTAYPPSSGVQARPKVFVNALLSSEGEVNGEYLGCTERLPMGALRRDKDFRGGRFEVTGNGTHALSYVQTQGVGTFSASLAKTKRIEQKELNLLPSSVASGQPGEILVQVDGEAGNYATLTNFRTLRGGSAFSGGGSHPGGEVYSTLHEVVGPQTYAASDYSKSNVLVGRAYLVRNQVTNTGSTEVSAGDELMMLIVTSSYRMSDVPMNAFTGISTNGTGEGISASDLYRIEGRPLMANHVRYDVDPTTIAISNKTNLGTYLWPKGSSQLRTCPWSFGVRGQRSPVRSFGTFFQIPSSRQFKEQSWSPR